MFEKDKLVTINIRQKFKIGISAAGMTKISKFCDNATHNIRSGQVLERKSNRTNNFGVESIYQL